MLARVLTFFVGMPVVIALVFYRDGLAFAIGIGLVAVVGILEFYAGAKKAGVRPWPIVGVPMVIVLVYASYQGSFGGAPALFAGVMTLLLVLAMLLELLRTERRPLVNVGATVLGAAYIGWLISHLVQLRSLPGWIRVGPWESEKGAWLVMFVILSTWACDTGAYFVGRFFGRHKLVPRLSPGKTAEGSVGGLVSSILIAEVTGHFIRLPAAHSLALGALIGIVGQAGDLVESSIKREIGIKDFGSILPGHGGALDRFDSLLFTGPLMYYYVVAMLPGWLG